MASEKKDKLYIRYPAASVWIYNGTTVIHFLLGGAGLVLGYPSWVGYLLGGLYLAFAFAEMYIVMPLKVCPNCVYYRLEDSLCVSGLNLLSRKMAEEGNVKNFSDRAQGILCHNNMYMASLFLPVLALIPALIIDFSPVVLGILVAVIGLLLFRFFVIFPRIACVYCRARNVCPNARSMGLSNQ